MWIICIYVFYFFKLFFYFLLRNHQPVIKNQLFLQQAADKREIDLTCPCPPHLPSTIQTTMVPKNICLRDWKNTSRLTILSCLFLMTHRYVEEGRGGFFSRVETFLGSIHICMTLVITLVEW